MAGTISADGRTRKIAFVESARGASLKAAYPSDQQVAKAQRICIVLHDLSGGGTESVAIRLANAWARDRRVTIFCGSVIGPLAQQISLRVTVVEASPECPRGYRSRHRLATALARHLEQDAHDLVFAPGNFHLPILARFAALDRKRTATVCKISNPLARSRSVLARIVRVPALRWFSRRIDCFVAMSPALRTDAVQALGSRDIAVAWDPILELPGSSLPAPAPSARALILAAGRLEPQKNFGLMLRAFARTTQSFDVELLILGEGSERPALERLAVQLGIADRVSMPGRRKSIGHDLRRASLFVLSSSFEGYPAVLVEAVAAGVPVVSTACSRAVLEILAGYEPSNIVEPRIADLERAMRARLTDRTPRCAGSARLLEARHNIDDAARAYLKVLDSVVARRSYEKPSGLQPKLLHIVAAIRRPRTSR